MFCAPDGLVLGVYPALPGDQSDDIEVQALFSHDKSLRTFLDSLPEGAGIVFDAGAFCSYLFYLSRVSFV